MIERMPIAFDDDALRELRMDTLARLNVPRYIVTDRRSLAAALRAVVDRSDVPQNEIAARVKLHPATLRKYLGSPSAAQFRAVGPSLLLRIVEAVGARVVIEAAPAPRPLPEARLVP